MANRGRQLQRWVHLQRERALTLVSLRNLNEQIEDTRPGLPPNPPLDNFTIKLGGTSERPGVSGLWVESYIKQALAERIIDEDEAIA
jgi:hypothetical protein